MATWGFYIYDKSQSNAQTKEAVVKDSTEFRKAVQEAVKDSLQKVITALVKYDTVFISKDSALQQQQLQEDSINAKKTDESEKNEKPRISRASLNFAATGINFAAITTKEGNKPEVTSIAKESEKFILSFMLQNKILPSSVYNIYVVVTQPDQKTIRSGETGNDYFIARKEGRKSYTQKIHLRYIHKSKKTITCIIKPENFLPGVYFVQIYYNGEMIGQTYKRLQ